MPLDNYVVLALHTTPNRPFTHDHTGTDLYPSQVIHLVLRVSTLSNGIDRGGIEWHLEQLPLSGICRTFRISERRNITHPAIGMNEYLTALQHTRCYITPNMVT